MKFLSLAAITFALVACAIDTSQIPEPTPEMAMEFGVEEADLHRGLATYMLHCNRCHERVPPGQIDPEYWRGILPHMAKNAELSESEEYDLLLYLMAAHGTVHGANLEH